MKRSTGRRAAAPTIDVQVQSPLWDAAPAAEKTVREAIAAAATFVPSGGEVSIALADDDAMRELNRQWRGIDKPTNVLSFPASAPKSDGQPALLGDVIVAYETVAAEAANEDMPVLHHLPLGGAWLSASVGLRSPDRF